MVFTKRDQIRRKFVKNNKLIQQFSTFNCLGYSFSFEGIKYAKLPFSKMTLRISDVPK